MGVAGPLVVASASCEEDPGVDGCRLQALLEQLQDMVQDTTAFAQQQKADAERTKRSFSQVSTGCSARQGSPAAAWLHCLAWIHLQARPGVQMSLPKPAEAPRQVVLPCCCCWAALGSTSSLPMRI